jgi:cyclopropane-fatty-acyl-phospholipid synthase
LTETNRHNGGGTARLAATIRSALGERPFELVLWDGVRVPATAPGPTVSVRSPRAVGHLLRAPGQLGLVRAYVEGLVDADDLDAVVELGDWTPYGVGAEARARIAGAAVAAAGRHARPRPSSPGPSG